MIESADTEWRDRIATLRAHLPAASSEAFAWEAGVAGARLSFRSESRRALEALVRPVAGLTASASTTRQLVVEVSEGAAPLFDEPWLAPASGEIHPRLRLGDGRSTLGAAWPASGMLAFVDRRVGQGHVIVREAQGVGISDAVTLVRALIAWWLADEDAGLVHAAAVAGSQGAVLLTGSGGAGKSSTAARAFLDGFDFIGDDSVFCDGRTCEVFCVNTYMSLFEGDFDEHYGALGRAAPARHGKAVVNVASLAPDRLRCSAPIRAVVAIDRTAASSPGLRPASRGRVLASLAPSSIFIVPNDQRRTMAMIANLLRRVPCYALTLGPDRARVTDALRGLLGRGEPT